MQTPQRCAKRRLWSILFFCILCTLLHVSFFMTFVKRSSLHELSQSLGDTVMDLERKYYTLPPFPTFDPLIPIPRQIFLTSKTITPAIRERIDYLLALHPNDFKFTFFDDEAARSFIEDHLGPRYAGTYDRISKGAHRADFFRYIVLFFMGGFYIDTDNVPLKPLSDLVKEPDVDFVSVLHEAVHPAYNYSLPYKKHTLHQGLIVARQGSPLLWRLIQHMRDHPDPLLRKWAPLRYHYYCRAAYRLIMKLAVHDERRASLRPGKVYTLVHKIEGQARRKKGGVAGGMVIERARFIHSAEEALVVYGAKGRLRVEEALLLRRNVQPSLRSNSGASVALVGQERVDIRTTQKEGAPHPPERRRRHASAMMMLPIFPFRWILAWKKSAKWAYISSIMARRRRLPTSRQEEDFAMKKDIDAKKKATMREFFLRKNTKKRQPSPPQPPHL